MAVNKTILAQHSKYFEDCASSSDNVMTFDSKIVSFAALETLVQSMDSGKLTPTMDDVESLIYAADYLQIHSAIINLFDFIENQIVDQWQSFETMDKPFLILCLRLFPVKRANEKRSSCKFAVKSLPFADGIRRLHMEIPFVLVHHFKRIMNEPMVLKLEESLLRELLLSDYLLISEEEVLRTIKVWVYYDFPARRDAFRRLVRCLRPDDTLTVSCQAYPPLHNVSRTATLPQPQFIVDELACSCTHSCECLTSVGFVVSILAHKLNSKFKDPNGPLIWKKRCPVRFVPPSASTNK